ncbi:MAG TPA: glycosyltransferase family 4 protein [Rhodospirillales bacterium]|nr:glycosyltransferase family 4 protein [Rhodospirillales bacterium]
MRIAFYAPMKPPDHPAPSGDRRMARLLMAALDAGGHSVELASRFRSYDGTGAAKRQGRLGALGSRLAARLVRRYRSRPARLRPQAWFTYHLYHKAPDWLGPQVADNLGIPYVVAEASHAPKQRNGPWAPGWAAAAAAISRADLVLGLNAADAGCVKPLLGARTPLVSLRPFLDAAPYAAAVKRRDSLRRAVSKRLAINCDQPWLLSVAMMRPGDKLASYKLLGRALADLRARPWCLLVAGDGPARGEVQAALADLDGRVQWLGELSAEVLAELYAASDLFVWPAVNEAYGMALLEAQAAALPVVAGRVGGVPDIVIDGTTGVLVEEGDTAAFARAVAALLDHPERRGPLGTAARRRAARHHGLEAAARTIDGALRKIAS